MKNSRLYYSYGDITEQKDGSIDVALSLVFTTQLADNVRYSYYPDHKTLTFVLCIRRPKKPIK